MSEPTLSEVLDGAGRSMQVASELMSEAVDEVERLRESLRWVRQTVHQAHHEGPIESCPKNTCREITRRLEYRPPKRSTTAETFLAATDLGPGEAR